MPWLNPPSFSLAAHLLGREWSDHFAAALNELLGHHASPDAPKTAVAARRRGHGDRQRFVSHPQCYLDRRLVSINGFAGVNKTVC
jgi:hypothetical protein